jgi:iron-sulfur cluster repair protein YtfE (RIC family)
MNAAELLSALHTVEKDHELVLEKMQALKEAIQFQLGSGETGPRKAVRRLREMDDHFTTQFAAHMDEEETALFPLLARQADDGPALVARLQAEHADIQRRCEELGKCLDVADQLKDAVPHMVLLDLLGYGWELWEALDHHAHLETRAVHQCLARLTRGQSG